MNVQAANAENCSKASLLESGNRRSPLLSAGVVLALFAAAIGAIMLNAQLKAQQNDPFKSPELLSLKATLASNPKDNPLKERIRALDLELRERHFRYLFLVRSGAWLAIGSAAAALVLLKYRSRKERLTPRVQIPAGVAPDYLAEASRARRAAALAGVTGMVGLLAWGVGASSRLPAAVANLGKAPQHGSTHPAPASRFASATDLARNWPRFRGFGGTGASHLTNAPGEPGSGFALTLAWKTQVPARGFNSPIVWEKRVFLSGGDAAQRKVFCFDAEKGGLLWEAEVTAPAAAAPSDAPEIPEQTGYAASTMATDGERVYAIFANGEVAAWNLAGKPVWAKHLGYPKNAYGHAASLETWEGRLLVQWDQGQPEQNQSKLIALEGATGAIAWQRNRPVGTSWATPAALELAGKAQIVTLSTPWLIAYAPKDGSELWRVDGFNGEVTPSPIAAGGLVLAVSPNEKLAAIRPDGKGEVTKTHLAWETEENIPDITSPVSDGELVYVVTTPGLLTAFDLKDGKKVWEQDLAMECHASPGIAGNRLYFLATDGTVLILQTGRTFKELGRISLEEKVYASPAFANGQVFIRGVQHLFCLGSAHPLAQSN